MIHSYDEKKKFRIFAYLSMTFTLFSTVKARLRCIETLCLIEVTLVIFKGNFYSYVSSSFNITQLCLHCRKKGKSHRQIGENPKNVARFVRLNVRIVIFVYSTFNEALLGGVANKYVSLRRRVVSKQAKKLKWKKFRPELKRSSLLVLQSWKK